MGKPIVRPSGRRHNHRVREGRGFSVDRRRHSRSEESLNANVERLKAYQAKLVLFPKASSKQKKIGKARKPERSVSSAEERQNASQVNVSKVFPIVAKEPVVQASKAIKPEQLLAKNSQYLRARRARADARLVGVRVRREEIKQKKAEEAK